MMSNNEEWQKIKTIVSEIIEAPIEKQPAYLSTALQNNPTISDRILEHYHSINESEVFWEETINGSDQLIHSAIDLQGFENIPIVEYKAGSRIGAYLLDEQIGKGGMGIVFKANRADGQFERVVAIKLMALHIQFEEVQKRFEQEQKILASLNHPNIAQLYDAGVTAAGNPYLVMEYVKGADVLSYAKRNDLSINDRVSLFLKICEAVEFAHRNLIIHRDLKPANILVTDEGNLKVLDFGIAKLMTDSMDTVTESITQHQQRIYSLSYASPEQVSGTTINTSTDIYTLGLLLYELLTGTRYHQFDELSRSEAEKNILDSNDPVELLNKYLPDKDLQGIVRKATRTEPSARYNSVSDLKADLERYLNNKPVLARKGNTVYLVSKFWKRNKIVVSFSTIALLISITFFMFYSIRITSERRIAELEAERAQLVTDYLIGLFEQADPTGEQGRDQTVADFVQQSIDDLSGLDNDPILQQEAAQTLAFVSFQLGNLGDAEQLYYRALNLADRNKTDEHRRAAILYGIAFVKSVGGRYRDALPFYDAAKVALDNFDRFDDELNVNILRGQATAYAHLGNTNKAEELLESAFDKINLSDSTSTMERIQLLISLADIVREEDNFDASVLFESQALSLLESMKNEKKDTKVLLLNNLGFAYRNLEHFDEAIIHYERALEASEILYGVGNSRVLVLLGNIASLERARGNTEKYLQLNQTILDRTLTEYGEQHWRSASAFGGLAMAQIEYFPGDALSNIDRSVTIFETVLGVEHFWTLRQRIRQALVWYKNGKYKDADDLMVTTISSLKQTTDSPLAYYDLNGLKTLLTRLQENEYTFGVDTLSDFFVWYNSNIAEG